MSGSPTAGDPYDLARFLRAQDAGGTYERAVAELRRGQKESHWMWFVFPQLAGLGNSSTARRYSIGSLGEATAYLSHPLLGARLRECAALVAARKESAEAIFGPLDALKLRSSMTLFLTAAPGETLFEQVLSRHFAGERDDRTEQLLARLA